MHNLLLMNNCSCYDVFIGLKSYQTESVSSMYSGYEWDSYECELPKYIRRGHSSFSVPDLFEKRNSFSWNILVRCKADAVDCLKDAIHQRMLISNVMLYLSSFLYVLKACKIYI